MNNADKPANPTRHNTECFEQSIVYTTGLTKREYFAGLAMQAIVSSKYYADFCNENSGVDKDFAAARASVSHADALLKALEE